MHYDAPLALVESTPALPYLSKLERSKAMKVLLKHCTSHQPICFARIKHKGGSLCCKYGWCVYAEPSQDRRSKAMNIQECCQFKFKIPGWPRWSICQEAGILRLNGKFYCRPHYELQCFLKMRSFWQSIKLLGWRNK